AAAGCDRACPVERPVDHPCRRADREPGLAVERRDPFDLPAAERSGQDRRDGDARAGRRRALQAHRPHARRHRLGRRARPAASPGRGGAAQGRRGPLRRPAQRDRQDRPGGGAMKLLDSSRSALQSIIVNKLRSALTMLGVIIGVASVIAMVAVGSGASIQIQQQVLSLGSNLVTVTPGNQNSDTGLRGAGVQSMNLTLDDMNAIQPQLGPTISAVEAEQQAGRWQVTAAGQNWNSNVVGVTTGYTEGRDWPLETGSFFTNDDVSVNAQVAVIGSVTAANLFGDGVDPTGQTIQLRQVFGGGGGPAG